MKKLGVLSITFFAVFSMFGVASAASFGFNGAIDNWDSDGIWGTSHISTWSDANEYQDVWDNGEFAFIQFDKICWLFIYGGNNHWGFHTHGISWPWLGNLTVHHWPFHPKDSSPAPVPEPSTLILLGMGVVGIAGTGYKKIFKKE